MLYSLQSIRAQTSREGENEETKQRKKGRREERKNSTEREKKTAPPRNKETIRIESTATAHIQNIKQFAHIKKFKGVASEYRAWYFDLVVALGRCDPYLAKELKKFYDGALVNKDGGKQLKAENWTLGDDSAFSRTVL